MKQRQLVLSDFQYFFASNKSWKCCDSPYSWLIGSWPKTLKTFKKNPKWKYLM